MTRGDRLTPVYWTRRPGHRSRTHLTWGGVWTRCGKKIPGDDEARVHRNEGSTDGGCRRCWNLGPAGGDVPSD